ncbi:MAG TPA: tetratricopeptide repeat protein [Methanotrichaceae archaeon]|nr:tetratricopeptide repeat protein [Methanotrichaceae archaeon]
MKSELAMIIITLAATCLPAIGQGDNIATADGANLNSSDDSGRVGASSDSGPEVLDEYDAVSAEDIQDLVEKGQMFAVRGNYRDSIRAFDRAAGLDPKNASIRVAKGNALSLDLARYNESILAYDAAIQIDPKDADAWAGKGDALASIGRREEAISAYSTAIEIDPKSAGAWRGKGDAMRKSGDLEGALKAYDRAIRVDPLDAGAWKGKSIALQALDRDSDAYDARVEARELGISI